MKGYRVIKIVAFAAVCPAVVGLAWGWFGVHPLRLPRSAGDNPGRYGVIYQDVWLQTVDGLSLAAWYTVPKNGALILVGHGYGNGRGVEIHSLFARHGYGVLSWDFRAHGKSDGSLCTVGYYEVLDVEAALNFALAQPEVDWVGIWGGSMGGIAGVKAAARWQEIRAVIIDSVPASFAETVQITVRPALIRSFAYHIARRETGINLDIIRPVDEIMHISPRPVFIIQGLDDQLIPTDSARRLCDAAGQYCTLWIEPQVKHLEMHHKRPIEYEQRVIRFLDDALLNERAGVH
jgi:dipeptidyl aminopeptidase/acylaminoacyl peptidase